MTNLAFYGGVSTIGGNCVVLEEDSHRIMLDNGMCFLSESNFFTKFLNPREGNGIRDYIKLGLIPTIDGIYGKEVLNDIGIDLIEPKGQYLFKTDIESYESYTERHGKPFIDGILLSHAHLDHFRNLIWVHPKIPVYCSQITFELLKTISEISKPDGLKYSYPELGNLSESSFFPGAIKKDSQHLERTFIICEPYKPYQIGPFTVTGYPTDHSLVGSMAFHIKTKNGKQIVYTGDIRFHGLQQDRDNSKHFIDTISKFSTDALIVEGTNIDNEQEIGEDDVFQVTLDYIKRDKDYLKKLIFASFPWKNISRFLVVYKIAKELKRKLVIQPKLAYLLHNLNGQEILGIKDILQNDDLQVYLPRKRSMLYSMGDYVNSKVCVSYNLNWDKKVQYCIYLYEDLFGEDIMVKAYKIHEHPEQYILHLEFYNLAELIDIQPPEGSLFFSMKTEPYDDEGLIEQNILENWIRQFKLNFINIHASGHAPGSQILKMVELISPKIVFPIHTEKPGLFNMKNAVTKISTGKKYEI